MDAAIVSAVLVAALLVVAGGFAYLVEAMTGSDDQRDEAGPAE